MDRYAETGLGLFYGPISIQKPR